VAERDRLLSDCRALNSTEGSNPSLPARKKTRLLCLVFLLISHGEVGIGRWEKSDLAQPVEFVVNEILLLFSSWKFLLFLRLQQNDRCTCVFFDGDKYIKKRTCRKSQQTTDDPDQKNEQT
jgi:hypothetical protein